VLGKVIPWELEPIDGGTRLTLWHNLDRRFISTVAAGRHLRFDVLDRLLSRNPIGRISGREAMKFDWQCLNAKYAGQFGVESPSWQQPMGAESSRIDVDRRTWENQV
jgi:hypothetical protein